MKRYLSVFSILVCLLFVMALFASCDKQDTPAESTAQEKSAIDSALLNRYKGDWNGCVEFVDATGKYADTLTGTVAAIARLNIDDKGTITPFIGLNVEDTPIENLSAKFVGEVILLSGKWISVDFKDVRMTESNGTLSTRIDVSKEAGSVSLVFNFRRLDDTGWTDEQPGFSQNQIDYCMGKSFDELAEIIGYSKSDYPEALETESKAEESQGGGSDAKPGAIIGSWEYTSGGYTYTFNDNGTGSYSAGGTVMEFTYEDTGSTVSILYTGNTMASEYGYTISGNTLIIEDSFGDKVEYTKK
ncbi:MAG: hypothetical protein J6Z00_03300 [Clostridia bacterium]|nr:hypothetical protein [Clostridia bacterium]